MVDEAVSQQLRGGLRAGNEHRSEKQGEVAWPRPPSCRTPGTTEFLHAALGCTAPISPSFMPLYRKIATYLCEYLKDSNTSRDGVQGRRALLRLTVNFFLLGHAFVPKAPRLVAGLRRRSSRRGRCPPSWLPLRSLSREGRIHAGPWPNAWWGCCESPEPELSAMGAKGLVGHRELALLTQCLPSRLHRVAAGEGALDERADGDERRPMPPAERRLWIVLQTLGHAVHEGPNVSIRISGHYALRRGSRRDQVALLPC